MESLIKNRLFITLVILLAITFSSWSISRLLDVSTETTGAIMITLAFIKVRLIVIYFMELPSKPAFLKVAFEGWIVSVWLVTTALYTGFSF